VKYKRFNFRKVVKMGIPEDLNIWDYKSYDDIPPAKKGWITIKAKKQGKNPVMVHAGIKARFNRKKSS